MAVDEVLLESAINDDACSLRWYRWDEPTVSLGYFQESSAAAATPQTAGLAAVRRMTGGGAILHHHEWTYSIALPASHPLAQAPHQLYSGVHDAIVAVLRELEFDCRQRGANRPETEGLFLCFGRGDQRDIVCGSDKVVGSAQRRRRGAVLQHGSLLIARSEHAPEFPGIRDLYPNVELPDNLPEMFIGRIAPRLAAEAVTSSFSATEAERVAVLHRDKYSTLDWHNLARNRR
jgi:lipoate-protein ligase A